MKLIKITIGLLSCVLSMTSCSYFDKSYHSSTSDVIDDVSIIKNNTIFYYNFDEKIYLTERKDILYIKFKDKAAITPVLTELGKDMSFQSWSPSWQQTSLTDVSSSDVAFIQATNGEFSTNDILRIKKESDVLHLSYLIENNGNYSIQTNRFLVKLYRKEDFKHLEEWINKLSCKFIEKDWLGENVYLISIPKDSPYTSVELSCILEETELFEYTSPDFGHLNVFCSNDLYYDLQWGLWDRDMFGYSADINIEPAWAITEGNPEVRIAILDTGLEMTHPDLWGQCCLAFDETGDLSVGPVNSSSRGAHGTNIAGIIGAVKDNGIGIAGIAPKCKIISANIAIGSTNEDTMVCSSSVASAINFAVSNGASVINCSWKLASPDALITSTIYSASQNGRNGKGCVFVFSSGNIGAPYVEYPANLPYVMAVGSHSRYGTWASHSNYGVGIDVVAPGDDILTTDTIGNSGKNPPTGPGSVTDLDDKDYTINFGGTSASAPYVSGIAALILSKYPDLSQGQVRRSIELGCTRPSGYTYQVDNNIPAGLWNNQVGYGRVDAYAALQKAAQFHLENIANSIPGIDFTITNESSYNVENIFLGLYGNIGGVYTSLFSSDPGSLAPGQSAGFPTYRGEDISAASGTSISDLELEIYAETPDCSGNLRISISLDGQGPQGLFSFGAGNSFYLTVPDTTVPNGERKRLYITIMNPLN